MKKITWSEYMSPDVVKTATDEKGVQYEIDQNGIVEVPEDEKEFNRVAVDGAFIVVPPRKTIES